MLVPNKEAKKQQICIHREYMKIKEGKTDRKIGRR